MRRFLIAPLLALFLFPAQAPAQTALVGGGVFIGSAIVDIVAAPASARWHNERSAPEDYKSPSEAGALSGIATVVPTAVGIFLLANSDAGAAGLVLATSGLVAGPAMGHFYAERADRAWTGIAFRGAIIGATILYAIFGSPDWIG